MPAQITLPIVGTEHPNKKRRGPTRRFAVELCQRGEAVTLRPEPGNEFDEHAIAVDNAQGMMMGYIPANRAVYVGGQMRRGVVSAVFQGATARGGFVRIAFDGETPILPPPPESQEAPDEWWPDPEFPD